MAKFEDVFAKRPQVITDRQTAMLSLFLQPKASSQFSITWTALSGQGRDPWVEKIIWSRNRIIS